MLTLLLAFAATDAVVAVPPGPCDELVTRLHDADPARVPPLALVHGPGYEELESSLENRLRAIDSDPVTPACQAAASRGAAPAAVAAARALTQRREPGWVDRGRTLLCAMQDPASLGDVAGWIDDRDFRTSQAVCAGALATWPGAEPMRPPLFARALRKGVFGWEIDPALVAAANVSGSPELRDQLVPVLESANAHHALGSDRLRDGVCAEDEAMSTSRARACATLPAEAEAEWPTSEPARRWLAKGAATALFAGAVIAAAVEQDHEAGRAIATAAGVPLGAVMGLIAGAHDPSREPLSASIKVRFVVGAVVGGALGGVAAHALAAKPGARAPVTGLALAPLFLGTVVSFTVE